MNNEKISVVTPTFNRKNPLKKNFLSVINQTVSVFEHIIIDNCSDDGTEELVAEYWEEAPYNVVYIREFDSGIYNAMNKGIRAATGDWIHILNSDDYLVDENVYNRISNYLEQNIDMILCPIVLRDEKGNDQKWDPTIEEWRIPHPGMVVQKSYYEKVGLFSEKYRIVSDAIWKFKNIPKSNYRIVDVPLTVMTLGGASTIKNKRFHWENFLCVLLHQPLPLKRKLALSFKHLKNYIKALVK